MTKHPADNKGFTLLELLLYLAIFAIVSGLFIGSLTTITKVQVREKAEVEVQNQLTFAMQRIQQLIRESSAVMVQVPTDTTFPIDHCKIRDTEVPLGTSGACLRLRMPESIKDPICIYQEGSVIKIAEGPPGGGGSFANDCNTAAATDLTTSRVTVPANGLKFFKFSNPPGHDTVQIELTLEHNDQGNLNADISRKLMSAVSRVSAATFDTSLLPPSGTTIDLGSDQQPWSRVYAKVGSAGAPAYTFTSDTLSGMYSGGGGILRFSTGGAERLEIDASGNVKANGNYFQLKSNAGAPAGGCTVAAESGRMYWDATNNNLYVCNGGAWKKVTLL